MFTQIVFLNFFFFFFFPPDVQVKSITYCRLDYCFGVHMRILTKESARKSLHMAAMLSVQQVS